MQPTIITLLDPVVNFGKVTVSTGYNDTETSIVLSTGDGSKLPDPSIDGSFNLVWFNSSTYASPDDDPNVEIVRCIARIGDTLTLMRGQEGTSASNKNTPAKIYRMILSLTKKTITDIQTDAQSKVNTHSALNTGVHGVGADTIDSVGARNSAISSHSTQTTSVHNFDASGNAPAQTHDYLRHTGTIGDHTNLTNIGTNTHAQIDTAVTNSANHISAMSPHIGHEITTNKNIANGYAGTDVNNYIVLARFQPIMTVASPYLIGENDYTIVCGAEITVTLPNAIGIPGRIYNIKNISTGIVTVATTSSQTIDGSTTRLIKIMNESITVQSNNENWLVI